MGSRLCNPKKEGFMCTNVCDFGGAGGAGGGGGEQDTMMKNFQTLRDILTKNYQSYSSLLLRAEMVLIIKTSRKVNLN